MAKPNVFEMITSTPPGNGNGRLVVPGGAGPANYPPQPNIFIRGAKRLASVVDNLKTAMLARAPGRYQPSSYGAFAALSRPIPFWSLFQIEKMLLDPQVSLCLSTIKGPLHGAVLKVTSPRPEVAALIQDMVDKFWQNSLSKALSAIDYGAAGGEVIYCRKDGQIRFERLRDFYISDMKVLTDADGEFGGIRAQNLKSDAAGKVVLLLAGKAFWTAHRAKHGMFYGVSQCRGAYETWYEKSAQGGAIEIRRLWFYKCAFNSGAMKHPTGSTTGPDGNEIPNHDIAREIIEKMATGATVTIPSDVDPASNHPRWEIVDPKINGNATEIREYPRDLDKDICKGMGVPPEVLEANDSGGSGYAGRKIPQDAFYATEEEKLSDLIRDIKTRIGDPLVLANFGEAIDYEIESEPLKPKDQQPQQPPGGPGGMPGQPGQPPGGGFGGPQGGQPGGQRLPMPGGGFPRRLAVSAAPAAPIRLATIVPPISPDAAAFEQYNQILDAIAAAGMSGAAEIFEDVRQKLRDRMYPLWQTGLTEEALSQARAIVAEAEPLIARTITDSLLAAWLVGADQVAGGIAQPFTQTAGAGFGGFGFDEPPPPTDAIGILFPGGEPDRPGVRLPQVEVAAKNLAERAVMTRDEFDQLGREAQQQAFTVAGQDSAAVVERVRDMMSEMVETGPSLEEFNERLDSILDERGSPMSEAHRETVYRTNVQSAYSQGFDEILNHPIVVDEFPYIADSSIADARRSDACSWFAVNGIDGSNVYRADDPTYREFNLPRHWNCRTGKIALSIEDAAARGIREAQDWLRTGQPPEAPYRMPYPPPEILKKMFAGAGVGAPVGLATRLSAAPGAWVTIGANKGAAPGHKGGTPVQIGKDGQILKGAPTLVGKNVKSLDSNEDTDARTNRKQLADSRGYSNAKRRKDARLDGLDPNQVEATYDDLKAADAEEVDLKNRLVRDAYRLLGVDRRHKVLEGEDWASIPGADQVARQLSTSEDYQFLFKSRDDEIAAAEELYSFMVEGIKQPKTDDEIWRDAMDLARYHKEGGGHAAGQHATADAVPFSLASRRKFAKGQQSIQWDESEHPRDDSGEFAEKGGGGGGGAAKQNKEIEHLKKRHPNAKPETVSLTDAEIKKYSELYDFYKSQASTDWERIKKLEEAGELPPVIFGGTADNRWLTDGVHRAALAANRGETKIQAYFDPGDTAEDLSLTNATAAPTPKPAEQVKDETEQDHLFAGSDWKPGQEELFDPDAAPREPWELTPNQYHRATLAKEGTDSMGRSVQLHDTPSERATSRIYHRSHVMRAIGNDNPVPPEIVAEYPEIWESAQKVLDLNKRKHTPQAKEQTQLAQRILQRREEYENQAAALSLPVHLASKPARGQQSLGWDESDHPRGQPDNAGEFAPKGGGKKKTIVDEAKERTAVRREGFQTVSRTDEGEGKARVSKFAGADAELEEQTQKRLVDLKGNLPPSWTDIQINTDPDADMQLVAKDKNGETKYIFHPRYNARQHAAKFERVHQFMNDGLDQFHETTTKDMLGPDGPAKEAALVLYLQDQTGFRIDSGGEAGRVKAYGASSLEAQHVEIDGDTVHFDFVGKEGVRNTGSVTDPFLAKEMTARKTKGGKLFKTTYPAITKYFKKAAGEDFLIKDLRTLKAYDTATTEINRIKAPTSVEEFHAARKQVGEAVAEKLNHTIKFVKDKTTGEKTPIMKDGKPYRDPGMALDNYISPEVFSEWQLNLLQNGISMRLLGDTPKASTTPKKRPPNARKAPAGGTPKQPERTPKPTKTTEPTTQNPTPNQLSQTTPANGVHLSTAWNESDHPRGQPDNAGQFGDKKATKKPATKTAKAETKPKAKQPADKPAEKFTPSIQRHGMTDAEPMDEDFDRAQNIRFLWVKGNEETKARYETAKATFATLPPALKGATREIVITAQKSKDDGHWAKEYNRPDFESTATGGDGTIVFYRSGSPWIGTMVHESAHNLATKKWGTTWPPSYTAYGDAQKKEPPVTEYGESSPVEDFADAVKLYVTNPSYLISSFPLKYAAIKELLSE